MPNIILAFSSEKTCNSIGSVLKISGLQVNHICKSGSNLRQYCGRLSNGIIICSSRFTDENIYTIIDDFHSNFTFIVIDYSGNLLHIDNNKCISVSLPVKQNELSSLFHLALYQNEEKVKVANKKLMSDAKNILQKHYNKTEEQAHKYIQKKSMDTGKPINEVCRSLLLKYSNSSK